MLCFLLLLLAVPGPPAAKRLAVLDAPAPRAAKQEAPAEASGAVEPEGEAREVLLTAGTYRPVFETATGPEDVAVGAFYLDVRPVTNAEFLAFVTAEPAWRRSRVPAVFAEDGYLRAWASDLRPGPAALPDRPVVDVSWFAARAYAAWRGRRLPTTDEWERAAAASDTERDGRLDPAFRRRLVAWYSRPRPDPLPVSGSGTPNAWGVRDLHGLVWEWTDDLSSVLATTDSRSNRDADSGLFCAAGSVGASDFTDYAAFLRFAYRGGLEARYAVPNLGFRTARSAPTP